MADPRPDAQAPDLDDSRQRMAVGGVIAGGGAAAAMLIPAWAGVAPFTGPGLAIGAQAFAIGMVILLSGLLKRRRMTRARPGSGA